MYRAVRKEAENHARETLFRASVAERSRLRERLAPRRNPSTESVDLNLNRASG
jgi:hypothetical protein